MLTASQMRWIFNRRERWNILLALKNGKISVIQAEKKLRALDS